MLHASCLAYSSLFILSLLFFVSRGFMRLNLNVESDDRACSKIIASKQRAPFTYIRNDEVNVIIDDR